MTAMLSSLVSLLTRSLSGGRRLRSPAVAIFCLALTPSGALAQYRFDVWTTDHGLPQNSVYNITQTRDGYLWFTTLDGLVRYDGVRFTVFDKSNSPGMAGNRLTCLFEDSDGALWMGTEDAGVTRYAQGAFTTLTTSDGLPHNEIHDIQADHSGGLQITTRDGLAFWRDGRLLPDVERLDIFHFKRYLSPTGAVWTFSKAGLRRIKNGVTTDYGRLIELEDMRVAQFYEDRQGNLWFGAHSTALFKIKDGAITRYGPQDGLPANVPLKTFYEDRQGVLWIGTVRGGLLRLQNGRFSAITKRDGLSSDDEILSVFEDREGNLWVGTNTGGINRLSRKFIITYSTAEGLRNGIVYPILQDRAGAIWIGAFGSLTRFADGRFTNYTSKDGLPTDFHAQALYEDSAGRLWVGDYGGLGWFKDGRYNRASFVPKQNVNAVHEDRAGYLWVGAEHGLLKCKNEACVSYNTSNGLPGQNVKTFYEDRRGDFWIGTYGGLARLSNGKFTAYTERDGLASGRVRYIYEDVEGTFWIGTYDGGLSRFKDGRFTNYRVENGLYNNGVFQILEDARGMFWIGCNKGIYRVSKRQLNDYADGKISSIICTAYDKQDGMLSAECNGGRQPAGLRASDGRLWFPTLDGVVVVDPEAAPPNTIPPPVLIESVTLDKRNVDFHNEVRVAPDQKYLEIGYTGLSFIKSEQTRFKYKLVGQDADWQDAGTRRVAYYSYLPPGRYTFTVTAANSDGVWNDVGASIRIVVAPPFWRTWWFLSLAALAVASLVFAVFRLRVAQLRRAHAAQEEFSRQLLDSQERERQRIAAELHDSLGQSLLIIKNRAFLALGSIDDKEETQEQLEEISASASHAIEEAREIAYNLRPYQIDRFGLTRTLEAIVVKASDTSGIKFTAAVEKIDGLFPKEAEINIYRIVQESVNNIIKHSRATEARLVIERNGSEALIRIEDNGQGFKPIQPNTGDLQRGGFGLVGMAERARMLGGVYTVDSAPGKGTTITIKLTVTDGKIEKRPDKKM
jgi:signal transduction histidine kinase/ligand-binding sensor domain-containing protein